MAGSYAIDLSGTVMWPQPHMPPARSLALPAVF